MATPKKLRCVIIGAGVSGILLAIKLRETLKDEVDFWIFEKNSDVGGTWFENRYPGCACDVPSHMYQFSFIPNPNWSSFYSSSAEIQSYVKAVAFYYNVYSSITFNTPVTRAVWSEVRSKWTVSVKDAPDVECEVLVNGSGILNNFKLPDIKNMDSFRGPVIHTADWDADVDLGGKHVAIIGAGASAIQTLPAIKSVVRHADVYIRTPSWIMSPVLESMAATKNNHQYTPEEKARFRQDEDYYVTFRKDMEVASNNVLKAFIRGSKEQAELRKTLEENMKALITDPALQDRLIPTFEVGCRRLSPGEPYLATLQEPNITPVFDEIESVQPDGVVAGGVLRPADVIIAATGFDTSFRPRFSIIGEGGVDLRDLWKDDPVAYCGLAVAGFPNYLVFLGPNTPISNGSVMGTLEATADYFVRLIQKLIAQDITWFNVRPEVQAEFDKQTQSMMQDMVWTGNCNSWFKNKQGKIVALWPGSSLHYREVLEANRWEDFEWKHKGNRFAYWGQGLSKIETKPDGDLAYYLHPRKPLPLDAYYQMEQNSNNQNHSDGGDLKVIETQPDTQLDIATGDLISYGDVDPVLAAKMHLLNETVLEFQPPYSGGAPIALYVGLFVGVLGWGLSADIIGRKWAFNLSLFTASIFTIIVGASPNYNFFAAFVALAAAGAGGNLALDTTVFLEFLPSKYQFMIVTMALWWGIGQTIAALLAWGFMPNFSCTTADNCPRSSNMAWRYVYFTGGGFVLILSMLRVFVFRFRETPKYLLCSGQDEATVELLQYVATKYNRPCSLTLEQFQRLGTVTTAHASNRYSLKEIGMHYCGLFATRKLRLTTVVLWILWACIGLAYPLYYMFLPAYLASRGAEFGETSAFITWRNYTLANFCAIFGPIFAGYITTFAVIGRKYTMAIGALITMAFFFAYTAVKNSAQNVALNCIGSFSINIFFSALYAYSPEVLPSAHRATGTGTAISMARIMGIVAAIIGTHVDTSSSQPIYVCSSLFALMAIVVAIAPYEPQRGQSI
ncbi:hypothetical protein SBRCBS47491_009296 [Sporothrix bragantina]|uniref:Major facilitator superfamily (MFS) profile domain-containing protein n=1 Tax=Sporothrix bragantina TaxID=671064 RepID=A0ABP0CWP5_9PEZI